MHFSRVLFSIYSAVEKLKHWIYSTFEMFNLVLNWQKSQNLNCFFCFFWHFSWWSDQICIVQRQSPFLHLIVPSFKDFSSVPCLFLDPFNSVKVSLTKKVLFIRSFLDKICEYWSQFLHLSYSVWCAVMPVFPEKFFSTIFQLINFIVARLRFGLFRGFICSIFRAWI